MSGRRHIRGHRSNRGFTIVELLIVVMVIATLAAITVVAYNGISQRAKLSAFKSELESSAKQLLLIKAQSDTFPDDTTGISKSDTTTFSDYSHTASTFCVTATSSQLPGVAFFISESGTIQEGRCPVNGSRMQTITSANCLSTRIRAVDARDNRTYWVQTMADGRCWMLTSLAYAGGGTNTYGDVKTLSNGTTDAAMTATEAKYFIPTGANPTSEPTAASVSTTGTGQYGYLYNWCAAMGNQQGTDACSATDTTDANASVSVCPSGWRLPTGGTGSEFDVFRTAVRGTGNNETGPRLTWLAQRSGSWYGSFSGQHGGGNAGNGLYWSSTQASAANGYVLFLDAGNLEPTFNTSKGGGQAVRCVAS